MLIEVVTFRSVTGTSETELIERDARAQTGFYYLQPGLVRRTLARGADGEWAVVTLWDSAPDADAALERAKTDPVASDFWSVIDAASVDTRRYESLD